MFRIACLIIGYFVGSFQSAYFVGKIIGKIDIRDYGSGNAGTTNMLRTLGIKAALLVFVIDVTKSILAYIICSYIFNGDGTFLNNYNIDSNLSEKSNINILPGIYAGLGLILGHVFPFYLKFKGGKGVACMLGIILCINIKISIVLFLMGVVILFLTRYMSMASLTIAILLPVLIFIFGYNLESIVISILITIILMYLHKSNIERVFKGKENKFYFKKIQGGMK